jgi:hypothetical protein
LPAGRRDIERLKIELPDKTDYPLGDNNALVQFQPGMDHVIADPKEIIRSHNYHMAYFGRQHVCEDWENNKTFAREPDSYPPTIDEAAGTTRVLHYDIAPRAHHRYLRIYAEFYFGADAKFEIQGGFIKIVDTTGKITNTPIVSHLGTSYAFVDIEHLMDRAFLEEPPIDEIEHLQLGIDVGNVVVGLDVYLTGDAGNTKMRADQLTMFRLSILDADITSGGALP